MWPKATNVLEEFYYHWRRKRGGGGGGALELYVYITLTNNYLTFFIYQLIILWTISIN